MPTRELDAFLQTWEIHASNIGRMLRALPPNQYDFRADPESRSIGELAWHLSEIDAYMTDGIVTGSLKLGHRPPGIERPREIASLAPGYERIHRDAVERVKALKPDDLDRRIEFFDGKPTAVREILWWALLHHSIHHLGQLTMMCRMSGGKAPGLYGPNREETAAMRAARTSRSST